MFCKQKEDKDIFFGGSRRSSDKDENGWYTFHQSTAAALLDIETGVWTDLPDMPEGRGGYASAIFRVDRSRHPLCFNLKKKEWVCSNLDHYPGSPYDFMRTRVLKGGKVIISTGCSFGFHTTNYEMKVYLLDAKTGHWTQLAELPQYSECCTFSCTRRDGNPVAFAGKEWASLPALEVNGSRIPIQEAVD